MTLAEVNALDERAAAEVFQRCCGSRRWVEQMVAARPFANVEQLLVLSDNIWQALSEEDWKEAFAHHPRIGDLQTLKNRFADTASWAADEQAGVRSASDETLRRLAEGNRLYEQRFGFIFLVCASGKSANEMLSLLETRLRHSPDVEITVAAAEQARITQLRLKKIFVDSS